MAKFRSSLAILWVFAAPLWAQTVRPRLDVSISDESGLPILGARIEIAQQSRVVFEGDTNDLGHISFLELRAGVYTISAKKDGYFAIDPKEISLSDSPVTIAFTMLPVLTRSDRVEVRGTVVEVEEATSAPNRLPPEEAKELPSRPTTVADVLPLTPGVVREPGGGLILSSSPENRSALIVNSADVTDPATGQFGLTVPIDSVEVLNVYQAAYLAEYGRFTSGLVSVETRRGGDKWKWELNDPLPEFRIRSYHLRGLKTATPRVNFEGPLIASKLFFSQGFEYAIRKTAVFTLPFPLNQKITEGVNSFSQLDWVGKTHVLTATMHIAPQRARALTLDYYNPLGTTPDSRSRNLTGTVTDRLTVWHGLLETRLSVTDFDGAVWGLGSGPFIIKPIQNSGDYFADQSRAARRISGNISYAFAPVTRAGAGTHQFKVGAYVAGSDHSGDIFERPINIADNFGRVLTNIEFPRTRNFEVDDIERSYFVQDHWILTPRLAMDLGVRTESQQISGAFRVAPRIGLAWTPFNVAKTTIRTGAGYFYDRVPLNVYAFNRYPGRLITEYDTAGNIIAGPTLFLNTLGQNRVRRPFVSQSPTDGNFSPRSVVWSVQLEQPITNWLKMRATYLHNDADGLVILNTVAPDAYTNQGAYLLDGAGVSHYRQFDVMAQLRLRPDRELFFSYTRSKATGDLNDFSRFLGTVPNPIIRSNLQGRLSTDLPNRFLGWGVVRLPMRFQIAPVVEYRSGFPYLQTDVRQQYVGVPYSSRFPTFFSLDARFSKDLKVTKDYSIRISISTFNLTNHFNPEQVHGNIADPQNGLFFGHRGRRYTADFDFLF